MSAHDSLRDKLSRYNQDHLLAFWDELSDRERAILQDDIFDLNLDEVNSYFRRANEELENAGCEKLDDRMKPLAKSQLQSVTSCTKEQLATYENLGLDAIAAGKVGVLLMAGGQGTRLGFAHPKGMYNVGLPSNKSLFQIQAERIAKLERLAYEKTGIKGNIAWYIMTSEHTMDPTIAFFEKHRYFGLNKNNVKMFEQGSLPCYTLDGKVILDQKYKISRAPDGNGGIYRAIRDRGILDDFERRGVEHLHAHSVDNILIKVADPIFIGYCIANGADCAAKVVEKSSPNEAVGVVCKVDGQYQVVEYSEITSATAELKNPHDGRLVFSAGNICNHYFTAGFLRKVAHRHEHELKLHVAKKKIPYVDAGDGVRKSPTSPNGVKIEKFVFDVFQFADVFVALEVRRREEFSALKNADAAGKDCPATARQDVFDLHREYVKRAGGVIDEDVHCEISPLLSYAGENLTDIVRDQIYRESPLLLKDPVETTVKNGDLNGKL